MRNLIIVIWFTEAVTEAEGNMHVVDMVRQYTGPLSNQLESTHPLLSWTYMSEQEAFTTHPLTEGILITLSQ